ncbi:GATA transcription factor 12 [Dorcoceras hygrometricum]|uniref:GATA transcription factor n=1 Tax=Dorcoceras hygrometricum TaxID=472368 RepID=A0A2Z7BRK2_9LAMI|nr:GATA transcription factor 12 [Dorcoceras hygrometricum]
METPEVFQTGYYNTHFTPERHPSDAKNSEQFVIEDLLDIPNDEYMVAADGGGEVGVTGISTDSSALTVVDNSCNSSFSGGSCVEPLFQSADVGGGRGFPNGHFSSELCVPYDDLAELEWLSNFTEESFSSEDLQKLHLIQGLQYRFQPDTSRTCPILRPETSVPAKARSKRSRATPGNWASRILAVAPIPSSNAPPVSSSSSSNISTVSKTEGTEKKATENSPTGSDGRKCLHCATDKTPQWRTGPMGPKTLCNACGVRYKSGRLVPEYRPASSPTFVLTKHSNSHRKVLELRRQKEQMRTQQNPQQHFLHHHRHQNMMFDISNGDDYLIHQHIGPDFRQLI